MPNEPQKDDATQRGDEILRRMLKTPPKPRKAPSDEKPVKEAPPE